jgi:hypothetical protein
MGGLRRGERVLLVTMAMCLGGMLRINVVCQEEEIQELTD